MSLPSVEIPLGAMRFNSDSQKLEYFKGDGLGWESISRVQAAPIAGRGLFIGGNPGVNHIDYVEIATTGNAKDFGDIRTGFLNYGSNALSDSHGGLS